MGALRAGNLDRRAQLLRSGPATHDGYQNVPGQLEPIGTVSASMKPAKGTERFEDLGRDARSVMSLWVRYNSITRGITAKDCIGIEGRGYAIVAPPVEIGRREGFELFLIEDPAIVLPRQDAAA